MTGLQAIIAGSAYVAGVLTVTLHLRSKCIPQNTRDQGSDEDGLVGHYAAASNLTEEPDHG